MSKVTADSVSVPLAGSPRNFAPLLFEMGASEMQALLGELDRRLESRGVAASVYLVGGAAMTLAYGRESLTPDIDAVASHQAVLEEVALMATEYKLPKGWLNENAAPYIPPRPEWAETPPKDPGLTIYVAPPRHLLAMKMVAWRTKDRSDIILMIDECDMRDASAEDFAQLLAEEFSGEGRLAQALGVPDDDAEQEAVGIGKLVCNLLASRAR